MVKCLVYVFVNANVTRIFSFCWLILRDERWSNQPCQNSNASALPSPLPFPATVTRLGAERKMYHVASGSLSSFLHAVCALLSPFSLST